VGQFLSGEIVLQTARMLREGLGDESGILVVEGATDKKLFRRLCNDPQQILVTDGKSILLDAHASMQSGDSGKIVFLVDCDGDVPTGILKGEPDLIVTRYSDLEADLVALGGLVPIVGELLPASRMPPDDKLAAVADEVKGYAVRLAIPIGRVRRAARLLGISLKDLKSWEIDFMALRSESGSADLGRAIHAVTRCVSLTSSQEQRLRKTATGVAGGYEICNGHDLVSAIETVLRIDYGVHRRKVQSLDSMLRMAMYPGTCSEWDVVRRLRRWQEIHGRSLLLET
jgi:hypothetical protein